MHDPWDFFRQVQWGYGFWRAPATALPLYTIPLMQAYVKGPAQFLKCSFSATFLCIAAKAAVLGGRQIELGSVRRNDLVTPLLVSATFQGI